VNAATSLAHTTYNATLNTAVSFVMDYSACLRCQPSIVLSVSSQSIAMQPLSTDMLYTFASSIVPNPSVLTVKANRPSAALSVTTLSSGFTLSTVGAAVSFTVVAADDYGNAVSEWPDASLQALHSKVCCPVHS
jgi:hypothetical protein